MCLEVPSQIYISYLQINSDMSLSTMVVNGRISSDSCSWNFWKSIWKYACDSRFCTFAKVCCSGVGILWETCIHHQTVWHTLLMCMTYFSVMYGGLRSVDQSQNNPDGTLCDSNRESQIMIDYNQRKTKGQQLKGKIVSNFSHFLALFGTFQNFSPRDFPLQNKGF